MKRSIRHRLAATLLPLAFQAPALAQTVEYDVLRVPPPVDGYLTSGSSLNNQGQVVGSSVFYGNDPGERAWIWSRNTGLVFLPPHPFLSSYRAIGINDDGVVCGDGGYDWGQVWRFADGAYETLGTLPGDSITTAAEINAAGTITGASRRITISEPYKAYLAQGSGPLALVLSSAQGAFVNDAGQVAGFTQSLTGFRYTPGTGVEFLPPLGAHVLVYAGSINSSGAIVGSASHANGNANVPFLFTDQGGMQEIGAFGGSASAADINDHGVVVGNFSAGGDHPWIWDGAGGVRFLDPLIDPAEGLKLLYVVRINERGDILGRAADLATFQRMPVLLVPRGVVHDAPRHRRVGGGGLHRW